jgi:hypothetical protein
MTSILLRYVTESGPPILFKQQLDLEVTEMTVTLDERIIHASRAYQSVTFYAQ